MPFWPRGKVQRKCDDKGDLGDLSGLEGEAGTGDQDPRLIICRAVLNAKEKGGEHQQPAQGHMYFPELGHHAVVDLGNDDSRHDADDSGPGLHDGEFFQDRQPFGCRSFICENYFTYRSSYAIVELLREA